METERGATTRRTSALPWDRREPRRPSAYAHYKKLVHDFDQLEDDLEQSRREQEALQAQLERHQHAVKAHEQAERDRELAAWTRERDRRVEDLCVHSAAVEELRQEHAALEQEEIRRVAELQVLSEKQQQANETDAKRVMDLVHKRTSVLENELAKGQMDLEFLTHVVSSARRKDPKNDAITAVVGTIRQRRHDAFRDATAQFQQRLQSFEREKEALARQTDELQRKKQHALKILSNNQQQVISEFFTTPRVAVQHPNLPVPSLEFAAILETMKQPTGDVVHRLQETEHSKASARRQLSDALADAQRNLENGPKRLDAIQQSMKDREYDALRLNILPQTTYDGAWRIETYRPEQLELVYFVRSLVFAWMDHAVEISNRQPATELLKREVHRYGATRAVLETLEHHTSVKRCIVELVHELYGEVIRDMAESIHHELLHSATKVRSVIQNELQNALFGANPKTPVKSSGDHRTAETLRWSMFGAAWEEIQRQRAPDLPTVRRLPRLLMRPAEATATTTAIAPSALESPPKKRFGLFSGAASKPPARDTKAPAAAIPKTSESVSSTAVQKEAGRVLVTEITTTASREANDASKTLWEQRVQITDTSFSSLSSCGLVTCLQFSSDGRNVALGTLDGEVIVFCLHEEETVAPLAVRLSPPDRAASGSSAVGVARIMRLQFSACGRLLLSYNQLFVATLWSLASSVSVPPASSHSADCFSLELPKAKPLPLRPVTVLLPKELFLEPPVPPVVLERDAPIAAARLQAAPPVRVSALSFFPSVSLTGEPTHVLCGGSNGDLLKLPIGGTTVKNETARPRWFLGPTTQAAFEAPTPTDSTLLKAETTNSNREFFRTAHRRSVLFVSPISPSPDTRLVSVDQGGGVAVWTYTRTQFSGFGWFVPTSLYQLDLAFSRDTVGEILQIQLSPDRQTLVLMMFASVGNRLRFVQLDLTTNDVVVKPVRVEVDMVGSIPPRFALLAWPWPLKATPRSPASPPVRILSLVLLMDNRLHVISLQTGELYRAAIPPTNAKRSRKEPALLFNAIAACSRSKSDALVAVAGEQHRQIRLYWFHLS